MHKKRVAGKYYFYTTKRSNDGRLTKSIYLGKDYKTAKLKENKLFKKEIPKENWFNFHKFLVILAVVLCLVLIYNVILFPAHTGYSTYEEKNLDKNLIKPQIITKSGTYNLSDRGNKVFDLNYKDGKREAKINGIKTTKNINLVIDRAPGSKVDYIKADPEFIESAEISLTYDPSFFEEESVYILKVMQCDIFDEIKNNCTSGWIETGINPIDKGDSFVFNITHFTTYVVSAGGTYFPLEKCLFYINNTGHTCSLTLSNYMETFGNQGTWLDGVSQYPRDGLVLALDLNNNTLDSSGYGNHGTIIDAANCTADVVGKNNRSCSFTPDFPGYINITNAELIRNFDKNITVSLWFYYGTPSGGYDILFSKADDSWTAGYGMYVSGSNVYFWVEDYSSYFSYVTLSDKNRWYHLVGMYNGTDIRMYMDGTVGVVSKLFSGNSITPNDWSLQIGYANGGSYPNGSIDEFAMWNRSFTDVEIKQLAWGSQNKYTSTVSSGNFVQSGTGRSNLTIDMNGVSLIGLGGGTSVGIAAINTKANGNVTFKNVYVDGFYDNFNVYGKNMTILNGTSMNALRYGFNLGATTSYDVLLNFSNAFYSVSGGILADANCDRCTILNANVSHSIGGNILTNTGTTNLTIKDSYFDNSSTAACVGVLGPNSNFINNTVKNCLVNDKWGFNIGSNCFVANNTFYNNNINLVVTKIQNTTFFNNIFNISYDTDLASTIGANVWLDGVDNIGFYNNTIENSVETGILLTDFISANLVNNVTFSGNIFKNTTSDSCVLGTCVNDLWIAEGGGNVINNVSIGLNHFYTKQPSILESNPPMINNISYCFNGEGNFYNESISRSSINETDCGLMNITAPDLPVTIAYNPYYINWTRQSSSRRINYSLYYTDNFGVNYSYINSTICLNYTWNTSTLPYNNSYVIKIIPNDGVYNGTNDNSTYNFSLSNVAPSIPALDSPANESSTTTRQPTFSWTASTDANADTIYYDILIDDSVDFTSPIRSDNQTGTSYIPTSPLNVDTDYYWKVRANDKFDGGLSDFSPIRVVTINSYVSISLNASKSVNFGTKSPGNIDDSTDDSPPPLLIQNDGNCFVNITVNASSSLWATQPLNTQYFKYQSGINESGSFSISQSSWTNMLSTAALFVDLLNYANATDNIRFDARIEVPKGETPGNKNADITFIAILGDHAS